TRSPRTEGAYALLVPTRWDQRSQDRGRKSRSKPGQGAKARRSGPSDCCAESQTHRGPLSQAATGPAVAARRQDRAALAPGWWPRRAIAYPRVGQGVGDVDYRIDQRIEKAEHQDDALDDRIVAAQDRIDGEAAEARNGEYAFGGHRAADQQC